MRRRLHELFWSDPAPQELLAGLFLAAIGGWLVVPWVPTFAGAQFAAFESTAPEGLVGAVMLVLGVAILAALWWQAPPHWRSWLLLGAVAVDVFWATLFLQSSPSGTGWVSYCVFASGAAWGTIRLASDGRGRERASG